MKLTDLISSYGDLLPEPAAHYAEIIRLNKPDFHPSIESVDLSAALADPASAPVLKPLDTVRIFSRFDFEPAPDVWVGGEVRSPGEYHTSGQAHLRDAIYLSGGVTPDASLDSAQLFRTESDGTLRILSVDLRQALDGNPVDNLLLQSRDRVLVHRNQAQVEAPTVYIKGEVAKPGRYPLPSNMRVADLIRVAGGPTRSAFLDTADLTRFAASTAPGHSSQRLEVKLAAVLSGDSSEDVPLRNGDVLTLRQIAQWNDLGSSVSVRGEVQHPASYGIEPGERLSSVLKRCGGFTQQAYPYGAVLIRREVRDLEMTSHLELVNRVKNEEGYLKTLPEADTDQKNAKLTAVAQVETTLQQLEATPPIGRVPVGLAETALPGRVLRGGAHPRPGDVPQAGDRRGRPAGRDPDPAGGRERLRRGLVRGTGGPATRGGAEAGTARGQGDQRGRGGQDRRGPALYVPAGPVGAGGGVPPGRRAAGPGGCPGLALRQPRGARPGSGGPRSGGTPPIPARPPG